MKVSAFVLALVAFQAAAAVVQATAPGIPTVGYYNGKCNGSVEGIVRDTVKAALDADITKGAALVRLFFHDCFVRVSKAKPVFVCKFQVLALYSICLLQYI